MSYSHVLIYHNTLINSYFSSWNFGLEFMEIVSGRGESSFKRPVQVPYQREATRLLQWPRQEPLPLQNVRPWFQVVTWLSYNKCLSWEINELNFLSLHFIWPTWLTGSFKNKKRSWKHLLESHAKPGRSPARHFPTLSPPP